MGVRLWKLSDPPTGNTGLDWAGLLPERWELCALPPRTPLAPWIGGLLVLSDGCDDVGGCWWSGALDGGGRLDVWDDAEVEMEGAAVGSCCLLIQTLFFMWLC